MRQRWGLGIAAVAVGLCGVEGVRIWNSPSQLAAIEQPAQQIAQIFVPDATQVFGKPDLRVLIIGLDYDYDDKDQETSKSSRSDIIMALHLDFANHRIAELSIPRDMEATLPNGTRSKINQAQSDGGINESQRVVADWLGIPGFDRHIILRIDTAKDLIDAVGGLDVNVQNSDALKGQGANGPLNYDDNWGHLHVHLKPGMQHLNGEEAVGYARFRHDWCSDPCRILRQQQIMRGLADKIVHNQWNTIAHLQQLINVAHRDIDTNFNSREELAAAFAFSHVTPKDIRTAQVPFVDSVMLPDYGDTLVPDENAKRQLVASMFSDGDTNAAVRLRIENGTAVAGLAAKVADELRQKGYVVSSIADAPTSNFAVTEIHGEPDRMATLQRVRADLGDQMASANIVTAAEVVAQPQQPADADSDVTIVLGRDIISTTK